MKKYRKQSIPQFGKGLHSDNQKSILFSGYLQLFPGFAYMFHNCSSFINSIGPIRMLFLSVNYCSTVHACFSFTLCTIDQQLFLVQLFLSCSLIITQSTRAVTSPQLFLIQLLLSCSPFVPHSTFSKFTEFFLNCSSFRHSAL